MESQLKSDSGKKKKKSDSDGPDFFSVELPKYIY